MESSFKKAMQVKAKRIEGRMESFGVMRTFRMEPTTPNVNVAFYMATFFDPEHSVLSKIMT